MFSTLLASLGGLTGSNISMVMLLVKATIILLVAVGITLSMLQVRQLPLGMHQSPIGALLRNNKKKIRVIR